jgi:predicted neutral ceramidase superfamily lipid hydrolase
MDSSSQTPSPEMLHYLSDVALFATICVVVIVFGLTTVGSIAFYRANAGQAKTFSLLIQRAGALQLIAVLAIVVGACLLTVLGKVNSEGIVSILSGIAGYVLGGLPKNGRGVADVEN